MGTLGVDIVEVDRVARMVRRAAFVKRVFSEGEVTYCRSKARPAQHFAVRWAAKEAVYKALGIDGLALKDIAVVNDASGRPRVRLAGRFKKMERRISITLSHTARYAVAVALCNPTL